VENVGYDTMGRATIPGSRGPVVFFASGDFRQEPFRTMTSGNWPHLTGQAEEKSAAEPLLATARRVSVGE